MNQEFLQQQRKESWRGTCEHMLEHVDEPIMQQQADSLVRDLKSELEVLGGDFSRDFLMGGVAMLTTLAGAAMRDLMETGNPQAHTLVSACRNVTELLLVAAERNFKELTERQLKDAGPDGHGVLSPEERAQFDALLESINQPAEAPTPTPPTPSPTSEPEQPPLPGFYL